MEPPVPLGLKGSNLPRDLPVLYLGLFFDGCIAFLQFLYLQLGGAVLDHISALCCNGLQRAEVTYYLLVQELKHTSIHINPYAKHTIYTSDPSCFIELWIGRATGPSKSH